MRIFLIIALTLQLLLPVICFSQKAYVRSFNTSLSGGSSDNNGFLRYPPEDILCQVNPFYGWMDVTVKNINPPISVLKADMSLKNIIDY